MSSSYTISAGISFRMIFMNIESSGLYFSAASAASLAFSTSSLHFPPSVQSSAIATLGVTLKAAAAVRSSLLAKDLLLRSTQTVIFSCVFSIRWLFEIPGQRTHPKSGRYFIYDSYSVPKNRFFCNVKHRKMDSL